MENQKQTSQEYLILWKFDMVSLFWIEVWIGVFMVLAFVAVAVLMSSFKPTMKIANDNDALKIVHETLDNADIEYYEVTSITTRDDTNITTVIVTTGFLNIALEIDNKSGKVISKERVTKYT